VHAIATEYADWLGTSHVPKLFLKAEPGHAGTRTHRHRGLSGTSRRPFATPGYVLGASNSLRRAVFFHRQGEFRDRTFENQSFRASGLSLLRAAIVYWNATYLDQAVRQLRTKASSSPTNCSLMLHRSAGNTSLSPAITSGALHSQLAVCVRYATFPRRSSCAPLSVQF
jgi:hypothetical protein